MRFIEFNPIAGGNLVALSHRNRWTVGRGGRRGAQGLLFQCVMAKKICLSPPFNLSIGPDCCPAPILKTCVAAAQKRLL